jgi:hypothetical protein
MPHSGAAPDNAYSHRKTTVVTTFEADVYPNYGPYHARVEVAAQDARDAEQRIRAMAAAGTIDWMDDDDRINRFAVHPTRVTLYSLRQCMEAKR